MTTTVALARNTIVQTVGKAASIALGWLIVLAMTNYLGAEGFGAYTIMTTYLQFFGVAVDLGFVLVSSQLLAEADDQPRVFANLLAFRLLTAAGLLALAPLVIWLFPYSPLVKQGVLVLTVASFVSAILQVFTGLFQSKLAMGRALTGELAGRLVLLGVVLAAIARGAGLLFVVGGVVLGSLVNVGLAVALAGRYVPLRLAADPAVWRKIWQRSWPIAAGIIFNLVYLKADTLVLSLAHPQAEVGVYGAVYRILEVLVTFPTMFAGLLLPLLSAAWARGDRGQFQTMFRQALDVSLYAAWPLVVGAAFTAPRLAALFGPDFAGAGVILWVLVLATAVVFVGTFFGHVLVAVGQQRAMIPAYAATAAIGLAGYVVFIPRYGAYGAAGMTVAAEALIATLAYLALRRLVGLRPSFAKLRLAVAASAPMALFLWLGAPLPLAVLIVGGAAVYLGGLYLVGGLTRSFVAEVLALGSPPPSSA